MSFLPAATSSPAQRYRASSVEMRANARENNNGGRYRLNACSPGELCTARIKDKRAGFKKHDLSDGASLPAVTVRCVKRAAPGEPLSLVIRKILQKEIEGGILPSHPLTYLLYLATCLALTVAGSRKESYLRVAARPLNKYGRFDLPAMNFAIRLAGART